MAQFDKADLERRMKGAVESLKGDLSGLRTGRANVALLDPVTVEVYGSHMPLNQVATVSTPEPRMLSVQVWDKSNVTPVEKAIRSAGLGLNPISDGQTLRLPARSPAQVFHLIEGRVKAQIVDSTFTLAEADTCCAPGYEAVTLTNLQADKPSFVFIADESPLHRKLGVYETRA